MDRHKKPAQDATKPGLAVVLEIEEREAIMRRAARVDSNQAEIVRVLREAGAYVWVIGLPVDLLVGYNGHTFLVEIKTDSKKRLTALQADFFEKWIGGTLARIDSPEAALRMIGVKNASAADQV